MIIKHFFWVIFVAVFTPLSINAQDKGKNKKNDAYTRTRKVLEPLPFHFSGLGSLHFYGLKLGIDYPLKMTEIRGFSGGFMGQRVIYEQYLSADAGIWHFNGIHENVFVSTEWTLRVINNEGFFWQISPVGVGANYLLPPFLKEKMMQDSLPAKNKFYVSPSVSMGIGRDFAFRRANRGKPLVIYLKGGISALYPFKTLGYLYPTAEAGLAIRISAITVFVKKVRRE